jgi:predicted peptidase
MESVAITTILAMAQILDVEFKQENPPLAISYRVALPENYAKKRKWPLVLFLHGAGERGADLNMVAVHGPLKEIAAGRQIPAVVVSPQCPADKWWDIPTLIALLDDCEKRYRIDPSRILVTGLSMGGYGTWGLFAAQPDRFAAIAPICAGGDVATIPYRDKFPIWAVHGTADGAVPFAAGEAMALMARARGADVKFETIIDGQHDTWTQTYNRDDFWKWLLSQRRGG